MNSKYTKLSNELDSYHDLILNSADLRDKERWASIFRGLGQKALASSNVGATIKEQRKALIDVLYFFAPRMGSFREDALPDLVELSTLVIRSIEDLLRHIYKEEGNETFNVDSSELFKVGDAVNLVHGKLLYVTFSGYKEYAEFVELHRYIVNELIENDISNMPQYIIQCGQHITVARHDAVVPSIT